MTRFFRIFFQALMMTLRGEKPLTRAQRDYPRLFEWLSVTTDKLRAIEDWFATHPPAQAQRAHLKVKIEGREVTMETILASVRFHLAQEYPYLLKHLTEHTLTGIYAYNMNDAFQVFKLTQADALPTELQPLLQDLLNHLQAIPPSTSLK
ncbi:MAG: hypothetical protein ACOYLB_05970 [Phototrophicaceae bacterium]